MEKLFDRLLWICEDQGINTKNKNVAIQELTGLSSGRVTQIKQAGEAGKLGEETVARLVKLGYRRDWVQFNKRPEKSDKDKPTEEPEELVQKFIDLVTVMHEQDRIDAWHMLKKFCLERASEDDEYLSDIVKYITATK